MASSLTLMRSNAGGTVSNVPAKIVFYTPNITMTDTKITSAGFTLTQAPIPVSGAEDSMTTGPDGYTLEMVQQTATYPLVLAIGFAVSDLQASVTFYTNVMGMKQTSEYDLGTVTEKVMQYNPTGHGSGIVLRGFTVGAPNAKNNPILQVHDVANAAATAAKIVMGGGSMVTAAAPVAALGNKIVAMTKDPDGYLIELVQSP